MLNLLKRSNYFISIRSNASFKRLQSTTTSSEASIQATETQVVSSVETTQPSSTASAASNLVLKSKFSQMIDTEPKEAITFARMFRHSKFVSLGDLQNKFLIGRVVDVVGDDIYIDYGGKFNCICKRPEKNPKLYQRNANVLVKLVDFEMASYFLSAAKHLTLLESNAILIGLFNPTNSEVKDERNDLLKAELNSFNSEPIY